MFFLNPTYLWAFLGLLVPIAIHLWNKKESKTIQVGSVQLLNESKVRKSKRIQLNELLLLLFRLLLLSVLVLILAQPQIKKQEPAIPITYIVESSLINNKVVKTIIDSLANTNEARLLEKGFPKINKETRNQIKTTTPNYWQLAKAMDTLPTDSIVVFTEALVKGINGIRPETTKNIEWLVLPVENEYKNIVKGTQKENELELLALSNSNIQTVYSKAILANADSKLQWTSKKDSLIFDTNAEVKKIAVNNAQPINVQLFYSKELTNEKNYIEAAFKALSNYLNQSIIVNVSQDINDLKIKNIDLTVWLSESSFSEAFNTVLAYKPNKYAVSLIEESTSSGIYHLTTNLDTENTIAEHLAEQLLSVLNRNKMLNKVSNRLDKRQLALEELRTKFSKDSNEKQSASAFNLSLWLWPFLMLLLIVERVIAKWRRQ